MAFHRHMRFILSNRNKLSSIFYHWSCNPPDFPAKHCVLCCSHRLGSIKQLTQNLDMQYCHHIKAFLTIFIQSFCSHQKAILFSAVLMVTSHSVSTVDLRLFVRTPTENAILLWSTVAAAIQFYQHKCLTNT